MEKQIALELREAWERLSRRNRWTLVDDLDAFLGEAAEIYAGLDERMPPAERAEAAVTLAYRRRAELAILQTYGRRLYRQLLAHDGRASEELRTYFYWHALAKQWPQHDAEDIASEATVRALTRLHTLRSPESIFVWRIRVFQSAQKVLVNQRRLEVPMPTDEEGEQRELPDRQSPTETVELRMLAAEFFRLLESAGLSDLDREILARSFIYDEKPREIAVALGRNVTNIRVRKSRALQALHQNERFIALLRELAALFRGEGGSDD